jgi:GTP cyclohydrolase II
MSFLRAVPAINFPTRWARFRLLGFEYFPDTQQPIAPQTLLALVLGDMREARPLVRIHSQCTTGDVFHSLRCDCHDQLHLALRTLAERGAGVLVYEHQEGRGIGLIEKLRAYALQDRGLDTMEANLQLGHPVDLRDYRGAIEVLLSLGIRELTLMTNNPDKIRAVEAGGIRIVERVSAEVVPGPEAAPYLATKRSRLGHLLQLVPEPPQEPAPRADIRQESKACG